MNEKLDLQTLGSLIEGGTIDTVLVCFPDMQGRLIGKRVVGRYFMESGYKELHACDYLLTMDMDMEPVQGYRAASWETGYGDLVMKPDLNTIRLIPWLEATALVMADCLDHQEHIDLPHAPRSILKKQVERAGKMGYLVNIGAELELYVFNESYESAREKRYRGLSAAGWYIEDYHIFQTTKEEGLIRAIRNGMEGAAIPVEFSKGEWGPGQEEINLRYAEALEMADRQTIYKNGAKEIAHQHGKAITFMAKFDYNLAGSSCHIHSSLWDRDGKTSAFFDPGRDKGMSQVFSHYVAGLLTHARAITYFLAPSVNSYKRFQSGTFAPTKAVWGGDNRTVGFRTVGTGQSLRIECRIPGGDANAYLAYAALIAAGLDGIEHELELEPAYEGNAYQDDSLREVPKTLREALHELDGSKAMRAAFGDAVIEHYLHTGRWEQREYDRRVTDWELLRNFERA
jgi:glutamine synthetase